MSTLVSMSLALEFRTGKILVSPITSFKDFFQRSLCSNHAYFHQYSSILCFSVCPRFLYLVWESIFPVRQRSKKCVLVTSTMHGGSVELQSCRNTTSSPAESSRIVSSGNTPRTRTRSRYPVKIVCASGTKMKRKVSSPQGTSGGLLVSQSNCGIS